MSTIRDIQSTRNVTVRSSDVRVRSWATRKDDSQYAWPTPTLTLWKKQPSAEAHLKKKKPAEDLSSHEC